MTMTESVSPVFLKHDLRGLLVLCPSYGGTHAFTEIALNELRGCGATVLRSAGCSDIALHRCLIAGMALEAIDPGDMAGNSGRGLDGQPARLYEAILWLDADMVPTVAAVERQLCILYTLARSVGWDRCPLVSQTYVQRTKPSVIAARPIPDEPSLTVELRMAGAEPEIVTLDPVHAGMGCLMVTAAAFSRQCAEAEIAMRPDGRPFPVITSSCMMSTPTGGRVWASEDFMYSAWHWTTGGGVYLDRKAICGHVGELVLKPSDGATMQDPLRVTIDRPEPEADHPIADTDRPPA